MAKSWENLKMQHDKIMGAYGKITPPIPSDEFESMRQAVTGQLERMDAFLTGMADEGAHMNIPGAEPEA